MNRTCEPKFVFPGIGYNDEALLDEWERRWGAVVLDHIQRNYAKPKAVREHEWRVRCISVNAEHTKGYWRVWDVKTGDHWSLGTNHQTVVDK